MKILKTFILLSFFQAISAQILKIEDDGKLLKLADYDTVDVADLCVIYNQSIQQDSLNKNKIEKSQMILQIGKSLSKYSNYKRLLNDSINNSIAINGELNAQQIQASLTRILGSGDFTEIFKNYPVANKYIFRKPIGTLTSYEEDIPKFAWNISDETLKILGYTCRKATCRFRGRDYIAWFASEIPVSNGPWKFGGLPGIILKVEDTKSMFRFEATAIYKPTWKMPITKSIRKSEIKTTRDKYNQAERRYAENPGAVLKNKPGIQLPDNADKQGLRPYNPMELE